MKFVHIKDIAKFNSNNLSSTTFKGGCVSYLDTGNLTNGKVSSYQHIDLSESKLPSRAKRLVKQNSILYSTVRPNQRHFGIIDANNVPENLVVSTGFTVIDVNSDVADPYFVYYFLQQEKIIKKLTALAEQNVSAYPSIKASDIGELLMPLPNIRQQRQSIQILKYIDEKIRINEQINDNLLQQSKLLFRKWFIDNPASSSWSSSNFAHLLDGVVSGDWGKDICDGKNTAKVSCIRGADIPEVQIGNKSKIPIRYILEKNYVSKHLVDGDIVIEINDMDQPLISSHVEPQWRNNGGIKPTIGGPYHDKKEYTD